MDELIREEDIFSDFYRSCFEVRGLGEEDSFLIDKSRKSTDNTEICIIFHAGDLSREFLGMPHVIIVDEGDIVSF